MMSDKQRCYAFGKFPTIIVKIKLISLPTIQDYYRISAFLLWKAIPDVPSQNSD